MKSTRRVLSLVLAMLMLFSMFSVVGSAKEVEVAQTSANFTGGQVLYLKPNSNWVQSDAWFAAYIWGTSGSTWVKMESCPRDSGYYKMTAPSGTWGNVIFTRMNPSKTALDWGSKWDQTADLTWDGSKSLFTVGSGQWNNATGSWSNWTETPEPTDPPVVDPEETQPEETQPEETQPEETQPEETQPEETQPEETEPEAVEYKVYCINSMKWDAVSAYAWADSGNNGDWPGVPMTKTEETVNGFDVYEITFTAEYANIIFNNNGAGSKTDDLELKADNYYDVKAKTWYTSLDEVPQVDPLSTDRYLVGSFNDWDTTADEFKLNAEGENTAYVTLTLEAETKYEFKVVRQGAWTSCATPITGSVEGLTFSSSVSDNATLTTTVAGDYVFSFGLENSQLSVTYPEVPTQPEETQPEETQPEETQPEETQPEETQPEETQPEETEPEIIAEPGYYLVGTLNGVDKWTVDADAADRMFKANEGAQGEYMLDYTFVEGDEIKVVYFDGTANTKWFNDGGDNYGIGAAKAGEGTIYFRPDGNSDWSYFYFTVIPKVVPTEPEETQPEATEPEATGDQPTVPEETEPEETQPVDVETIKIYFQNNWLWSDVHAYFYGSAATNSAEWPGDVAKLYANDGTYDVYYVEVPADIEAIVFNGLKDDGTGDRDQTPDITDFYDGACYSMTWNDKNDVVVNDIDVIFPPEETEPEETQPEETQPEETQPEETQPEESQPEETQTEATEPEEVETMTVYFQNNWMWTDLHVYFWGSATTNSAEWPGDVAKVYGNDGTYDVYAVTVPTDVTGIIFNGQDSGTGSLNQTPDIKDAKDGNCYYMKWDDVAQKNAIGFEDISVILPEPTEPEPTQPEVPVEKADKVTGLKASDVTRESFKLEWDALDGATRYWVYVNGKIYNKVTDNNIIIENRKVGTEYTVFVTAGYADDYITPVDAAEAITVTTLDYVYSYEATADPYTIHLTYDAVDCTKAWVYIGTDPENLKIYDSSKNGEFTIKYRESNTTYFVKITYLIDGVIVDNNDVFEVTTPVDEALVFTAEIVEDGIAVDWNALDGAAKYWVTYETAEKTYVYSTTATNFVIPNGKADCTVSVKTIVNKQMVYYYPVEL